MQVRENVHLVFAGFTAMLNLPQCWFSMCKARSGADIAKEATNVYASNPNVGQGASRSCPLEEKPRKGSAGKTVELEGLPRSRVRSCFLSAST